MSLSVVQEYFSQFKMEHRIMVLEESTATVDEAAEAHGVDPDQIAKTLSFMLDDTPLLIVTSGRSRIDNPKYKTQFGKKAKMLNPQQVLDYTGHAIGGVCPFGLATPIDVYLDVSLKKHTEIIPAAGDLYSSIKLNIEELEKYSNFQQWIDVSK